MTTLLVNIAGIMAIVPIIWWFWLAERK